MGWNLLACAIALLLVAGSGSARADVLSPPPERCPEGSVGRDCHGPPLCAALTCETDADCAGNTRCVERPLCARAESCAGGWGGPGTPNTHIEGPCGSGGTCEGWGTTCQSLKVCVAAANLDAGASSSDAGASTDAGGTVIDAGGSPSDAGRDAGGARADSGPSRQDAGGGATSGGGCCSAVGAKSGAGGALFVALMIVTALRRSRRR